MLRAFPVIALLVGLTVALPAAAEVGRSGPGDGGGATPSADEAAQRPFLGVQVEAGNAAAEGGLKVVHVVSFSTAADLGLRVGDVLQSLNGQDLQTRAQLKAALTDIAVGQLVTAVVRRGEGIETLSGPMKTMPDPAERNQEQRQKQAILAQQLGSKQNQLHNLATSLAELGQVLDNLPAQLDQVSKEFKQVYPDGTFTVQVHIDIRTGPDDETGVDLSPEPAKAVEGDKAADPDDDGAVAP